jgi:isocitrate lyase
MVFTYAIPADMGYLEDEERVYLDDVAAVKKWWDDSRWRYTNRPFTAEQIVQKRGNIRIDYPSNVQSKKLWRIVEGRFAVSLPSTILLPSKKGISDLW